MPERQLTWPQRPRVTSTVRPQPRASNSGTRTTQSMAVRALGAARNREIPSTRRPITRGGPLGEPWAPGTAGTTVSKLVLPFRGAIAANDPASINDKGRPKPALCRVAGVPFCRLYRVVSAFVPGRCVMFQRFFLAPYARHPPAVGEGL